MLEKAPTATPATTPAPAPATPAAGRDTYGDRKVDFSKIPVIGYQKGSRFTPAPTNAASAEGEPAPEGEPGKPGETPGAPDAQVAVLKAKNGRVFKDQAELLTTYDASSQEAQRLDTESKTLKLTAEDMSNKFNEANATILAMQEYIGNAAYIPNVPEKYKGMTEVEMLEAMTDDEKLDYRLDKREWSKKVENFKTQMAKARQESEAIAVRTKAEIDRNEAIMSRDKETYPDFTELKPLRDEIIKQSPHIANRLDSPYVSYYMAAGIMSLQEKAETAKLEADSRAEAAAKATADAARGGGGAPVAPGKSPAPKDDGLRGLVKAGKSLKSSF